MLVELGAAGPPPDSLRLPGTSRMSRSAIRPTRFDSARTTPGLNSMLIVKVPSLKGGRKARGSKNAPATGDRDRKERCGPATARCCRKRTVKRARG